MTTPEGSGLAVLRQALLARRFKGHLAPIARDHGVGTGTLEDFAVGKTSLAPAILDALAKEMFGPNVTFNSETDKLVRAKSDVTPLGVPPAPYKAPPGFKLPSGETGMYPPKPPQPKAKRAGWVE